MTPRRIEILGVPVDCVTMEQALEWAESSLSCRKAQGIIAVNPEKVMRARRDPALLSQLHRAGLLIPDGIGVVFAARLLGMGPLQRVPGSELMPRLCERAARRGYTVFLFGADPAVNKRVRIALHERYPGIRIVGSQHGYVKEGDLPEVIEQINAVQPDILFVALGSPRQEIWIDRCLPQLNVKLCQGVGGTFDVLAGSVKRAPEYLRAIHLEWFYRLATNPQRAIRQTALPLFAWRVLMKRVMG
ncbi:MAG: WecB/TagA/CpsF family glycosyltransferase [Nitrospiraceae bacterium]